MRYQNVLAKGRTRGLILPALLLLSALPRAGHAQQYSSIGLTASVGGSIFEFDEEGPYRGLAVRGGIGLGSNLDLMLDVEHWPSLGDFVGWSTQLDAAIYPIGRRIVSPRVTFGVGRFWTSEVTYRWPTQSFTQSYHGTATSFGLGVRVAAARGFALGLDGLVRFDAGAAGDAQVRGQVEYTWPGLLRRPTPPGRFAMLVLGMARAGGPWGFTEPGYGVRFTTAPLAPHHSASLSVALLHLHEVAGGYDSRSVLINPGWQWDDDSTLGRVRVRAGPAMNLMFEGPDSGVRGGAQIEVGTSLRLGPVPLTVGAGWLWIRRGEAQGTPGADLHGVILSAGIGL